jgi:FemAB-related protein (PEP-CTERM system-associated)
MRPKEFVKNALEDEVVEWNNFVYSHPLSTLYHLYEWRTVIEKSFGHKTFYLLSRDTDNIVQGILPLVFMNGIMFGKFLISLPFVNYGGLLCNDTNTESLLMDMTRHIQQDVGAEYTEFRHIIKYAHDFSTKEHKMTMTLELERDLDSQWKTFNTKLRNQIRKAMKSGLSVRVSHIDMLNDFYIVFSRNMRDLGTPVYSKVFFRNILETFPYLTKIFSVFLDKKVIASGIAIWFKDTFEMPWASSIRDYKSLCPNNLLYWEAIKFAIENGFKKFDFGRSTPHEGTYKFKEQWGARPVQLYWQYIFNGRKSLPELNPKNPKYQMAIKIWQKLPVFLTKIVGPPIVRNIP